MEQPKYVPILKKIQNAEIRFAIIGSYVLRNIRPLHDLDIIVHPDDWYDVLKLNLGELGVADSGTDKYSIFLEDGFEIELFWKGYPGKTFNYPMGEKEGYDIDEYGFSCWTMEQTIKWKEIVNRPKDIRDIQILKNMIIMKRQGKLKDMITVCAVCNKVRHDDGKWKPHSRIREMMKEDLETQKFRMTHGYCDECYKAILAEQNAE